MKFLHTMIRVTDIEKSLKFYQEVLGMKVDRIKELTGKGATLYFLTDEQGCCEIELTHNHTLPEGGYTQGTHFGHFAFAVDSMDEFTEVLKKNNLEYDRPPFKLTDVGSIIAFVNDPDGNSIELIQKM